MRKTELDSILMVNLYFTGCKIQKPYSSRTEIVRKYLAKRISKVLVERVSNNTSIKNKIFLAIALLLLTTIF